LTSELFFVPCTSQWPSPRGDSPFSWGNHIYQRVGIIISSFRGKNQGSDMASKTFWVIFIRTITLTFCITQVSFRSNFGHFWQASSPISTTGEVHLIWVGVYCRDPETVTLFMTKQLKFVYPVYDKRYIIWLHWVPVRIIILACKPHFDNRS